jgi:hypothetical protein
MNRSQLINRIDSAWTIFNASYAGLSDAEMMEPGVTGDWSVKDVIAHVTWWEEEALTHLPTILAGEKPQRYSVKYGGINAFNAQMAEQKKDLPLAEVLRWHKDTHRRLLDLVETAPEEHIIRETPFRHRLRLDTYSHYREHTAAIQEWREARERTGNRGGS